MTITSILNNSLSALQANQTALRAVSSNVANVNTEGYARLDANFIAQQGASGVAGVEVEIERAANAFLAAAEVRSAADISTAAISASYLDRAQGLFGDPSQSGTIFNTLDSVFASFDALAIDPSSSIRQADAISSVISLLEQLDNTAIELQALQDQASTSLLSATDEANALLRGIAELNASIQSATVSGADTSQAETAQADLINRLSEIVDIRVQERPLGGIEVRTTSGFLLADSDAATLSLAETHSAQAYPGVVITPPRSSTSLPFQPHLRGGEIAGLLQVRDRDLVDLAQGLGEFAAGVAEALNAAHNEAASVPAPASLVGSNSGFLATDQLNFTGVAHIAVTDADGRIVRNLELDFDAGQINNAAGGTTVFANSVGDLTTALNTALGVDGSATFVNGVLTVSATAGGTGVVVQQDPASPSDRAGRGFSHVFGLNDLVQKSGPLSYATGLQGGDPHGLTAGDTITFAIKDASGAVTREAVYTVGAGATIANVVADINTALGASATASLNADGELILAPAANSGTASVDVLLDTTERGSTGLSFSQVFGLGEQLPAQRARNLQLSAAVQSNTDRLAVAQVDLSGAIAGDLVLTPGDGRGAALLSVSGNTARSFSEAGGLASQTASVVDYGARLAGYAGSRAASADNARAAAEAVRTEISVRRQSEEGVNLDEELVKLTTYQQGYSAAARLIQAAQDLYDTLLRIV